MSSPEAQRLAGTGSESGSADQQQQQPDWHSMGVKSQGAGPKVSSYSEAAAQEGLMGRKSKKKKAGTNGGGDDDDDDDNIYDYSENDDGDDESKEDEFLDNPMWQSRGTQAERATVRVLRVLEKVYRRLYGDKLPPSEMLRTLSLAATLFFMIGGYWLLRSLKDPILTALCGVSVIPKAKMLSVFVVLGVVSVYNFFLDSDIPKHKLFYIFGSF
jgi:AAA family ATP:ADP antiporter